MGFSNCSNLHAWVKAGFAIQYLNTLVSSMLKLKSLAFFNKSADDVVSAINDGNSKQFLRSVSDVLKLLTTRPLLPKACAS